MHSWSRILRRKWQGRLKKYLIVLAAIGNLAFIFWVLVCRMPTIALWPDGVVILSALIGLYNCIVTYRKL
jgi:hypothetical protein